MIGSSGSVRESFGAGRGKGLLLAAAVALAFLLPGFLTHRLNQFKGRLARDYGVYLALKKGQEDPFSPLLDQGLSRLRQGREQEALDLLKRAAAARPFLLRHLLGPCRLSDLRWVTGPLGLRLFVRRVAERQGGGAYFEMEREIADYALCLFAVGCLEWRAGRREKSMLWLSQMRYLEPDPDRLAFWVGRFPKVRNDPALQGFLASLGDPAVLRDPLPWRMDDYGFGLFMVRLLTGREIRSGWDKRTGMRV